jgi:hypothetical protein
MPLERITFEREDVFGFRVTGRIEAEDVDEIAREIRDARREQKRLRMYAEIESDWRMGPKAWFRDLIAGLRNGFGFRAAAVVTDQDWLARAAGTARWLPGLKVRTFPSHQAEEARAWITSDDLGTPEEPTA